LVGDAGFIMSQPSITVIMYSILPVNTEYPNFTYAPKPLCVKKWAAEKLAVP
jgi:hypothetical protein